MKKYFYLFFILLAALTFYSFQAQAGTTFTVNTTVDEVDDNAGDGRCHASSGNCSLRAAVQEANAFAGDDTIILPAGTYTLTLTGSGEDKSATGDLDITSNITITGAGISATTIDGNGAVIKENIFSIKYVTVQFNLSSLKLTGGKGLSSTGGAITSIGSLGSIDLSSVEISNNTSLGAGGIFIHSDGNLTISDSVISNNSTSDCAGGGILFDGSGILKISNSTISNNSLTAKSCNQSNGGAGLGYYATGSTSEAIISTSTFSGNSAGQATGGGISLFSLVQGVIVDISNSTISGNSSASKAGGIIVGTDNGNIVLSVYSTTIANNSAPYGGGVYVYSNSGSILPEIKNSILATNTATTLGNDCYGSLTSNGYNFFGDVKDCTVTINTGDQAGDSSGTGKIDPTLGVLQSNGGSTFTQALTTASLAFDAGDPAGCTEPDGTLLNDDQRGSGYSRHLGVACDIGAYEVQPVCGDSHIDTGESCDDGNTTNGDGCSSTCQIEVCGDGIINNKTETCDDGNATSNDGCSSICQIEVCGDGIINNKTETCDDGNTVSRDGCSSTCQKEYIPVANAGSDISAFLAAVGVKVTLNGSGSYDPQGQALTYAWSVLTVPAGSNVTTASLKTRTSINPFFTADKKGRYTLQLTVRDTDGFSSTDTVVVTVK